LCLAGCCGVRSDSYDQKNQFEDVDHNKTENTEAVKSVDGLPDWIFGVLLVPHWNLYKQEKQINNKENDRRTGNLCLTYVYDFEGEGVFSVLPHEVTEKDDEEVVIRAYEAAEKANELHGLGFTTMASMVISMRWSVILSTALFGSISVVILNKYY
jgi:hypothetical protein